MTQRTKHTHTTFSRWFLSHSRACHFALSEFMRTPIVNFITVCVIGIAIALPLGFYMLLQNLQVVDSTWSASAPTISLYIKPNTQQNDINSMIHLLRNNNKIENVSYISPKQGLKTFEKNTPFTNVVQLFQRNPIPGVIMVLPTVGYQKPNAINKLYASLKTLPFVDIAQLDMNWVTRLFDVITIGKKITNALSLLFGIGVILIIGHTLRSSLSSHMNEIQVMRLVGATDGYIRRPLLYRGILYGLFGGIIAWISINVFLFCLQKPVSQLALTYHAPFQLQTISFVLGSNILLASVLAGFISAFVITTQFLNQPESMD